MQYIVVNTEDGGNITVFVKGSVPQVAHSSHPNFEKIVQGAIAGDDTILELFDTAQAAVSRFERLTERVTTANGRLYLDGEEIDNSLSAQVVRFLGEGVEDWKPLVNFFENVQANPNEHSREQLYTWLNEREFTITPEGLIVGYKGVRSTDEEGQFKSIFGGQAIVDGEVFTGNIPNYKGAVVEMPRGEVEWDPAVGCHRGLHVGTYNYAESFSQGALLEVHVNPRDVVSVPTDCGWAKMRVCRYLVVDTIDKPYDYALTYDGGSDYSGWGDGEDDEECWDCGDNLDHCHCGDDDYERDGDSELPFVSCQKCGAESYGDDLCDDCFDKTFDEQLSLDDDVEEEPKLAMGDVGGGFDIFGNKIN